ncbi:extracellular solute-binding protein [Enterobacter mori]|uniref:extracellular solute-binding protein n=1 Tax=Enterobacter mori TaxID=539813 RepID=UPI0021C5F1FF|nr:extracellular solute-binding protein [Enterobacter mori]
MENKVNAKINKLIDLIYGETFTDTHRKVLLEKIGNAASLITEKRKSGWDEKDVVLITYADQFSAAGENALPVFTRFYNKWLSHSFSHVHLLPFYPWSSDDGFSVIDYHEVAPETGTWSDIAELKQSASLMFDYVCNHMSAKSQWFANYLQQTPGYEDFFISVDPKTDLSAVTRPRALPLLTPFTLHDGSVRHLWTTFSEDQIDLNFASPDVLIAMVDVLLHYLMEGANYIRLDAVGFMWKIPGTHCIHLEQTHQLIQLFRAITEAVAPGTVIITETNVPHKDNISYFGNGENEAQMVYQFSLPPLVLHAIHRQDGANVFDAKGDVEIDTPEMTKALAFYKALAATTMPGSNDVMEIKDAFMNGSAPMAVYSTYILPAVFKDGNPANLGFVVPTEKSSAVYGMITSLTITTGQTEEETKAAEKFVTWMEQAQNATDWVMMSPGAALPVNKLVVGTETWKNNDVIKAFGQLPYELIAQFPNVQVFGAVGDKNFTRMGDVTGSGIISSMVHNVTVGQQDLSATLSNSQKRLTDLISQR